MAFIDVGQGDATADPPSGGAAARGRGRRARIVVRRSAAASRCQRRGPSASCRSRRLVAHARRSRSHRRRRRHPARAAAARSLGRHSSARGTSRCAVSVEPRADRRRHVDRACGPATRWLRAPRRITVLNPPPPDWERQKVRNDDSIVLEVRIGDVAVDPAGRHQPAPSNASARSRMLGPAPLVDRQGAASRQRRQQFAGVRRRHAIPPRSSSAPAAATRSVTRRPRWSTAIAAAGARIFRTDEDGEVVVDTDGHHVVVWTWSGRREEFSVPFQAGNGRTTDEGHEEHEG